MDQTQQQPATDAIFEYLRMFNQIVVADKEFTAQLPQTEFELSFNCVGDIYVDGTSLGVNVKERFAALVVQ